MADKTAQPDSKEKRSEQPASQKRKQVSGVVNKDVLVRDESGKESTSSETLSKKTVESELTPQKQAGSLRKKPTGYFQQESVKKSIVEGKEIVKKTSDAEKRGGGKGVGPPKGGTLKEKSRRLLPEPESDDDGLF